MPGVADASSVDHLPPPADAYWLPPAAYAQAPRRHPWEIPLLVIVIGVTLIAYLAVLLLVFVGNTSQYFLLLLAMPLVIFAIRGITYARPRVNGVQVTPTQFPIAYRMVVDAAARYGMEYVPDAYVILGNGAINAAASGHGFRRFVMINSDLFEIGGDARDPDALEFVIGHEVGHIAAGHVSYWRQLASTIGMNIPLLGPALSRAQEYTADNYGYYTRPSGAPGTIGVLSAGKYMLSAVDFDQFADRATLEHGFFTWVVNALASHPVLTWRAAALRDRTRAGAMVFRPNRIVRGVGSGNVMPIETPPHPASVPPGSLPNGLELPPKF